MSTADFSGVTSAITGTLTSSAAVSAYATVAGVGVAIGVVVKLGPKLWRCVWRFIPDEGYAGDDYWERPEEPIHWNSDGSWDFDSNSERF